VGRADVRNAAPRLASRTGTVYICSTKKNLKPATRPPLRSARLLDPLRERIRYRHYSLRTEQTYVYWVRAFVRHHGLRHPREMGAAEAELSNFFSVVPESVTSIATRRYWMPMA
jgi:hypothetical protein